MLITRIPRCHRQGGVSMIEVLVTAVIVSFSLLGLAGLQIKATMAERQVYERAQALSLLTDMTERIRINYANAAQYVAPGSVGTGDSQPANCAALAMGAPRDLCEWSNGLKGTSEKKAGVAAAGLSDARGCITQIETPNPAPGLCQPGVYQVAVAWRGGSKTVAPALSCGAGQYGTNDAYRRAIAVQVVVPLPGCL